MDALAKPLVWLAILAFVLAVIVTFTGPIMGIPAEALSRACNNTALIAIALMLSENAGSTASA